MANTTEVISTNFITETQRQFTRLLNKELKFDAEVDSWVLMSSPFPVIFILIAYILFVLKIGPKMMENREPLKIKHIMMIYNFLQTSYNFYIISEFLFSYEISSYIFNSICHPDNTENNREILTKFYTNSWHYMFSKMLDLIDTIFFVLRKKQSHVSFLHVYHHMNMLITTWIFLRFIKGQQGALPGIVNSIIHVIMYSYYFLSALGPQMQKYLWWKKYLTRLQIIQFIAGIIYGLCLFIYDCNFPRLFTIYMIFDVLLFLYLFLIFYKKTYSEKQKSQ